MKHVTLKGKFRKQDNHPWEKRERIKKKRGRENATARHTTLEKNK